MCSHTENAGCKLASHWKMLLRRQDEYLLMFEDSRAKHDCTVLLEEFCLQWGSKTPEKLNNGRAPKNTARSPQRSYQNHPALIDFLQLSLQDMQFLTTFLFLLMERSCLRQVPEVFLLNCGHTATSLLKGAKQTKAQLRIQGLQG